MAISFLINRSRQVQPRKVLSGLKIFMAGNIHKWLVESRISKLGVFLSLLYFCGYPANACSIVDTSFAVMASMYLNVAYILESYGCSALMVTTIVLRYSLIALFSSMYLYPIAFCKEFLFQVNLKQDFLSWDQISIYFIYHDDFIVSHARHNLSKSEGAEQKLGGRTLRMN